MSTLVTILYHLDITSVNLQEFLEILEQFEPRLGAALTLHAVTLVCGATFIFQ